jgi:hypothetical protein
VYAWQTVVVNIASQKIHDTDPAAAPSRRRRPIALMEVHSCRRRNETATIHEVRILDAVVVDQRETVDVALLGNDSGFGWRHHDRDTPVMCGQCADRVLRAAGVCLLAKVALVIVEARIWESAPR